MGYAFEGNFIVPGTTRWFHPIGPAPKGWNVVSGCSRTIPHDESSIASENDELNEDHYV